MTLLLDETCNVVLEASTSHQVVGYILSMFLFFFDIVGMLTKE